MIRQFELVERVQSYDPDADEDMLNRAYVYGLKKHGTQMRASGDPYFSHPVEVAGILAEMKLDTASIVTGLLHDTIEDTDATRDEIARLFGESVARLVDGVTKLSRAGSAVGEHQGSREPAQARAGDVVGHPRPAGEARRPPAQHAHAAPHQGSGAAPAHRARDHGPLRAARLAHRHGEGQARARGAGLRRAQPRRPRLGAGAPGLSARARRAAGARDRGRADQDAEGGRPRRPRSPAARRRPIRSGARCRTRTSRSSSLPTSWRSASSWPTSRSATRRWALIHGRYQVIPRPLQGLHLGAQAERLPLAAYRRDRAARPAHRDADPHRGDAGPGRARRRRPLDLQAGRAVDRCAAIRLAAQPDRHPRQGAQRRGIPRAHQARDVPRPGVLLHAQGQADRAAASGATPIDFAYAVHSQVGDTCVGSKINGRMLPLRTQLSNGDQVEIITSKAQTPSPTWERFVVTGKAKAAIRRFIRTRQREQYLQLGKSLLDKTFHEEGYEVTEKGLDGVRANFKQATTDDLIAAVGAGLITSREVHDGGLSGPEAAAAQGRRRRRRADLARAQQGGGRRRAGQEGAGRQPDRHPRADPRHGGALRALLPSAAGRSHRRHHHHRQGRDHPHHRLRHARELLGIARALDRCRLGFGERGRSPASTPAASRSRSPTSRAACPSCRR